MALHPAAPRVRVLTAALSQPGSTIPIPVATTEAPTISAQPDAIEAAELAAVAIADKKGTDILLLDVSELVVVTDVFLIATGTSTRHVKTLIEDVEMSLKRIDRRPIRREGEDYGKWVLLDYGDVVLHVFDRETRDFYELERLWADAPVIEFEPAAVEATAE